MNSAKLIAAAAALTATFAASADWLSKVQDATGFEGLTAGTTVDASTADAVGKFDGKTRFGWIEADGAVNTTTVLAYDEDVTAPSVTPQQNFASGSGSQYLKLNTEGGTLLRNIGDTTAGYNVESEIYLDATMQFTLSEEAPDLTGTDAKIAVWMGKDGDANCLYANAGCIDDPDRACEFPTTNAVYKLGTWSGNVFTPFVPSAGTWYRVTIRAIKNVTTSSGYAIAGFEICVNGQKLAADTDTFTADAQYSYTASEGESFLVSDVKACFPPLGVSPSSAALNIKGVGFQGTGLVDNYVATTKLDGDVEEFKVTIDDIEGLTLSKVTSDAAGDNVISATEGSTYTLTAGTIYVWFTAKDGYVVKGALEYAVSGNATIDADTTGVSDIYDTSLVRTVIANTNTTNWFESAAAAIAAAGEDEATVTLLKNMTAAEAISVPENVTLDLNECVLMASAVVNEGTIVVYDLTTASALSDVPGTLLAGADIYDADTNPTMFYPAGTTILLEVTPFKFGEYNNLRPTITVEVPENKTLIWNNGEGVGPYKQMFVYGDAEFGGDLSAGWNADLTTKLAVEGNLKLLTDVAIGKWAEMSVSGTIDANGKQITLKDATACKLTNDGDLAANTDVITDVDDYEVVCQDSVYQIAAKAYVASIGGKKYTSLADAIADAQANDTIVILADVSDVDVEIAKKISIDATGFTVTGKKGVYAIRVMDGDLTIVGGTFKTEDTTSNSLFLVGDWEGKEESAYKGGALTITDGVFGGAKVGNLIKCAKGTVVVNGGTFGPTNSRGIKADGSDAVVTINGGTLNCSGKKALAVDQGGKITVNGGVIDGTLNVEGTNPDSAIAIADDATATFNLDQSAFCSAAYMTALNGADPARYAVTAAAASIAGKTKYQTLKDAVAALDDGDTITLIADVSANGIATTNEVTLQLAGKMLTLDAGNTLTLGAATVIANDSKVVGSGLTINGKVVVNGSLDFSSLNWGNGGLIPDCNTGSLKIGATATVTFWAGNDPNAMETHNPGFLSESASGAKFISGETTYTYDGSKWSDGSTPSVAPGGSPVEVKAASADDATNGVEIVVSSPDTEIVSDELYKSYFTVKASEVSTGVYSVYADLKDEIKEAETETAAVADKLDAVAAGAESATIANAKPGLWYSVKYTNNVGGMDDATEGTRAQADASGNVTIPMPKADAADTKQFYQIQVNISNGLL